MVFWVVARVVLWIDTNVSEDRTASIFRVKVRGDRKVDMNIGAYISVRPESHVF
jgi:hypothetical protein